MKLKLKMPLDSTFLSQVIYEGLLYILRCTPDSSFKLDEVVLPDDYLHRAYGNMEDERIDKISINLTGNDRVESFLESINVRERPSKKTYRELLMLLKKRRHDILMNRNTVTIQEEIRGKRIFLDVPEHSNLAAPQLFKIDRYTGISSMEMRSTSEQLGLRASPEVILIGLLGIYSSHIITVRQQNNTYHYFIFLSPDEILDLLTPKDGGDQHRLKHIYSIKESIRELFSSTLHSSIMNEVMILEIMLNTKIRADLESKDLDRVNLSVFKVSPEGMTYKIYETIPITVYKDPMFYEVLSKRKAINADKVCEKLYESLSPNGAIMKALSSLNSRNKYDEADNILKAILGLYKFISLADIHGLLQFLRSLGEAQAILKDKDMAQSRMREYARIQKDLSYIL